MSNVFVFLKKYLAITICNLKKKFLQLLSYTRRFFMITVHMNIVTWKTCIWFALFTEPIEWKKWFLMFSALRRVPVWTTVLWYMWSTLTPEYKRSRGTAQSSVRSCTTANPGAVSPRYIPAFHIVWLYSVL